ncbi:nucleotide-binding protein [Fusibacter sp. JL298sf-3]
MKIAVLSGKGGVGKTFTAVNLAHVIPSAAYVDGDVEAPNGHLFLRPEPVCEKNVYKLVPTVDTEQCTGCQKCVTACRFNALAFVGNRVTVFEKLCHSCKVCGLVCPSNAVHFEQRRVGQVFEGVSGTIKVCTGVLDAGEPSGEKVVEAVLEAASGHETAVIDCAPGTACLVASAVRESDYCVVVGEPTAFGFDNMKMAVALVEAIGKPYGIVVNKAGEGDGEIPPSMRSKVLGVLPYDMALAKALSEGELAVASAPNWCSEFERLYERVRCHAEVVGTQR